jgi:colicin import membrane protein
MRVSRSEPGVVISSAAHAGLLVAALVLASDAKKFDDAMETIPVEVVADDALNQVTKGEKTARDPKPAPRVDKVAKEAEAKPHPPLAEARKDTPTPPPPLKRLPDPGADDKPEPIPPKRVAALPPAPEPPQRPAPEKKPQPPKPVEKPTEAKPTPAPPARQKAAAPEEKPQDEPKEAEVVRPKPPVRPKPEKKLEPEKEARDTPKPAPEKQKETRLKMDEVAKLLESKKTEEKPAKPQNSAEGEMAEKSAKGSKPKSGDENAPKSKFDAADIANLLSKEAPQRRAATGKEIKAASLGAPEGAAPKLSASMEARIAAYIHDHYHPCWASGLSLGGETFAPVVEFHLSREGALEGRPHLLNPSANPVEQARGEQALQAVRRCSPMKIPPEFMPYYEEALHDVTIRFRDAN